MTNLFESAGLVNTICKKSRTGMFREFWTTDLRTSLFEAVSYQLKESEETMGLLTTVKDKMTLFLNQVKDRLSQMNATFQEKKEFYSHLVNLIFSELGAGIEGPALKGPITKVRTAFPRDYSTNDRKQSAFIKRQYETLKDMFTRQGNPDPHTAAIDQIKNTWRNISPHILRSLGKEIKPKVAKTVEPVVPPEPPVPPVEPVAEPEKVEKGPRDVPLGKHKMTMAEIISDAEKHLDVIKKTVRSKEERRKSLSRYLGDKHFGSPLSRNPIIGVVVDKILGTDRLEGKPDEDQDKEKAKTYLSVLSAARTASTGANKPSVKKTVEGIDDLIQAASGKNRGYIRIIVTPSDVDYEGLLALARDRIRNNGCEVGETEKDDLGKNQPDAYKIYFSKGKE